MLYTRTVVLLLGATTVGAAFVEPPATTRLVSRTAMARATPAAMILDQMKAAAKAVEGQAAEAVVRQKVEAKLAKAKEKYNIPAEYEAIMQGFFTSYMTEVYKAGRDTDHYEKVLTKLFKQILENTKEPYKFPPYHEAIREPLDYYALGNEFATGVINNEDSAILGLEQIAKIKEQLAAGDNVVMLANHQSEADPQIFSVHARIRTCTYTRACACIHAYMHDLGGGRAAGLLRAPAATAAERARIPACTRRGCLLQRVHSDSHRPCPHPIDEHPRHPVTHVTKSKRSSISSISPAPGSPQPSALTLTPCRCSSIPTTRALRSRRFLSLAMYAAAASYLGCEGEVVRL